ncbi:hypothetical protein BH10PSE6_BH10PSE6_52170 [soil metagenome]
MRHLFPLLVIALLVPTAAASAKDRPVTDQERRRLEAALKEMGKVRLGDHGRM